MGGPFFEKHEARGGVLVGGAGPVLEGTNHGGGVGFYRGGSSRILSHPSTINVNCVTYGADESELDRTGPNWTGSRPN